MGPINKNEMNTPKYYLKLWKKFQKVGGKLSIFCRKRKLNYDRVRKGFERLRADGKIGDNTKIKRSKRVKLQDPATVDVTKVTGKNRNLPARMQKLLEQELSTEGKTHAQMAKDAGYMAKNLSNAFYEATRSQNYQETLAYCKKELRKIIGIPGQALLTRLIEIGLSRPSDIIELNNGEITIRADIDFEGGADLAIKSITSKSSETMFEGMTETRKEFKFEPSDNQSALVSALKIGGYFDDSVFNSIEGGDEEVIKLWGRFQLQEITANDMSIKLAMRGLAVPPAIQLQAKAELAAIAKGGDEDVSMIDLMDSYDEMLEDEAIAKKKAAVEAERKKELEQREIELEALNREEDEG